MPVLNTQMYFLHSITILHPLTHIHLPLLALLPLQSMMSLMYASRAKRIRNVSVVNCDAWRAGEQPQSGLGQVSADLLGLEQRLAARTQEFDRLKDLRSNDQVRKLRALCSSIIRVLLSHLQFPR